MYLCQVGQPGLSKNCFMEPSPGTIQQYLIPKAQIDHRTWRGHDTDLSNRHTKHRNLHNYGVFQPYKLGLVRFCLASLHFC